VIPSGHRAYPEAKAKGDKSIPGKARRVKATKTRAGRGPDEMVKAELLEPKCPLCKHASTDTVDKIRGFPDDRWSTNTETIGSDALATLNTLREAGPQ
jgi:hypothetical protein